MTDHITASDLRRTAARYEALRGHEVADDLRAAAAALEARDARLAGGHGGYTAPSGWKWRLRWREACIELQRREADDEDGRVWVRVAYLANNDWRRAVPPCDHDYVAALIERECAK